MPHRSALVALLLALPVLPVFSAAPPPAPPWEPAIERLILQLGDREYSQRALAERQLTVETPRILPLLRRAVGDPNPEVRQRARRLLHLQENVALFNPRRVTLTASHQSLAEILEEISRQTGYKVQLLGGPGEAHSVAFRNLPFWEAIDRLCRQTHSSVQPSYGDDVVRLHPGAGYAPHVNQVGAFRFVANSFQLSRQLDLGLVSPTGATATSRNENLTFNFTIYAEPRLPILGMGEIRVEAAYDNEKNSLLVPREAGTHHEMALRGMGIRHRVGYNGNKQLTQAAHLSLRRVSEKANTLSVVRGSIPLHLLIEQKPIVLTEKILSAKGVKVSAGEIAFHIEDVQKQAGGQIAVKVSITNKEDGTSDYSWTNSLYQRLELVDDKGGKYQLWNTGWSGTGPNHVQMTLTFHPGVGKAATLPTRLTFQHWITRHHDAPFEFRNLPLP